VQPSADTVGRIGPNSIIQTVAALRERLGAAEADAALRRWGHEELTTTLPEAMVPEEAFNALTRSVFAGLGAEAGREVLERAGILTAEYLLANRIPAMAQQILPWLPSRLGLRILSRAIRGHAWTFAGNGVFEDRMGAVPAYQITGCPMCRGLPASSPTCSFYQATFQRLLRVLIRPTTRVEEIECEATGGACCRFIIRF
jgi:divinyl protochlorophyllide a 8-vinyl-reductase